MTVAGFLRRVMGVVTCAALTAGVQGCSDPPTGPSISAPFSRTDITVGTGTEAALGNGLTVNYTGWLYRRVEDRCQRAAVRLVGRAGGLHLHARRRRGDQRLGRGAGGDEGRRRAPARHPAVARLRREPQRPHPAVRDAGLRYRAGLGPITRQRLRRSLTPTRMNFRVSSISSSPPARGLPLTSAKPPST